MKQVNKIKVFTKAGVSQMVIYSSKGQQISESELFTANNHSIAGLLPITLEKEPKEFKLICDITGLISLKEYLSMSVNRKRFIAIVSNLVKALKNFEEKYFNRRYILLSIDRIMVKPSTCELFFVPIPIQNIEIQGSLRELFQDVLKYSRFEKKPSETFIKEYQSVVNQGINISLFAMGEYAERMSASEAERGSVKDKSHKMYESTSSNKEIYNPADVNSVRQKAYAARCIRTGERMLINKSPFTIGRSGKADFCIADNPAIGRIHATIMVADNKCYIKDECSTNGTYVNETQLGFDMQEVKEGSVVKLAMEEFVIETVT